MFYTVFKNTIAYDQATINGTARMISQYVGDSRDYKASIHIDALSKSKKHFFRTGLSRYGIRVHNVRGIAKEENSALIRLADSLAGFVMDALDGDKQETAQLFRQAVRRGMLAEARE